MKKSLKKLFIGIPLVTALILSACGNDSTADSSGNDEASNEVSVAVWGYDANPEFQALVKGFEAANSGVTVKVVDIDSSSYEDRITTMLAGQDNTDVLGMKTVGSYVNYASRDQLVDLTDLVDEIEGAENFGGSLEGFEFEGAHYALPMRRETNLLYYNKGIFDENNMNYPHDLTWEEYEELAQELTTVVDGKTVYGAYHHTWDSILTGLSQAQKGESIIGGDYGFLADRLNQWVRMQNEGATLDYSSIKIGNISYSSQFENQDSAMMIMGSFYVGKLIDSINEGNTDIDWAVTTIPQENKGESTTFGGVTGFGISKHANNPELAEEFIKFISGEEGAKIVASIGMTPAYQSDEVLDTLFSIDGMPEDEESRQAFYPESNVIEMPADTKSSDVDQIVGEEYDLIMVEDISVEEGIQRMEERYSEIEE